VLVPVWSATPSGMLWEVSAGRFPALRIRASRRSSTKFSIEKSGGQATKAAQSPPGHCSRPVSGGQPTGRLPERFVGVPVRRRPPRVWDLARVRDAAGRHMASRRSSPPTARHLFHVWPDHARFHDDPRPTARDLVSSLSPAHRPAHDDVSRRQYYLAAMIQNKNDPMALQARHCRTMTCMQWMPASAVWRSRRQSGRPARVDLRWNRKPARHSES